MLIFIPQISTFSHFSIQDVRDVSKQENLAQESKKTEGLFSKAKQKVTHHFTKNYISDNAEQLKKYVEKLKTELFTMENNISIKELLMQ